MSYIGDEIKRTRMRAGMTSRQVAEAVTLTPQYIRLIECGGAIPAVDTTLRICNLFSESDSARWAWLLLIDLWGQPIQDMMWAYARRSFGAATGCDCDLPDSDAHEADLARACRAAGRQHQDAPSVDVVS